MTSVGKGAAELEGVVIKKMMAVAVMVKVMAVIVMVLVKVMVR